MSSPVRLRRLKPRDIPTAHELRRLAGWNQTERDWAGFLSFEPEGCVAADVDGRLVGTATTITYGRRFGWIGMVLVHPEQRRGGIGTALLGEAIRYLRARGVAAIKLDATPLGKKVYVPLGFQEEYDLARYEGIAKRMEATTGDPVQAFTESRLAEVIAFDAEIFGATRPKVVTTLSRRNPELGFVLRRSGAIAGYIIAREGSNAVQIGPWCASDADAALPLLRSVFRRVAGRQVFVDVPGPNRDGAEMMQRLEFTVQRTLTRMYLGENRHPGKPEQTFGVCAPEKG